MAFHQTIVERVMGESLMMTNEELAILAKNDREYILPLWQQVGRLGIKIAHGYKEKIETDDLEQLAFLALYEAVNRFDAAAGCKFSSFYASNVKWTICEYLEENGCSVRLPSYLYQRVNEHNCEVSKFIKENGRKPTESEIKMMLSISDAEYKTLQRALSVYYMGSLDAPLTASEDSDIKVVDTVADSCDLEGEVTDLIQIEQMQQAIRDALGELPDIDRYVVEQHYFGGMTLEEIAETTSRSAEAVRQRGQGALKKLRTGKHSARLQSFLPEKVLAKAYKSGLNSFKQSWESSVERSVFELLGIK